MRYQNVKLAELKTVADHTEAIDKIENDKQNSDGDWYSGGPTFLKPAAAKKIKSIWRQFDKNWPEEEEEEYGNAPDPYGREY